jgi:hypothetical protein
MILASIGQALLVIGDFFWQNFAAKNEAVGGWPQLAELHAV